MRATENGILQILNNCYISIPEFGEIIYMDNLPEIGDSKSASFPDEPGMGRSTPFKTYASSENRTISWKVNFFVQKKAAENSPNNPESILRKLRVLEACTYPRNASITAPYLPPPVCRLRCGQLLARNEEVCAVMKRYSVTFDTSVPWDIDTYLPYKLTVDMEFDVVYDQFVLPGAEKILNDGY
jgi:hypothetical protein